MHVYAVELRLDSPDLNDDLFERALQAVDESSRSRIRKFFRREDAWRCLVGRTLPCYVLVKRGVSPSAIQFSYTDTGKPYISGSSTFKFNVSHDSSLVVLAYDDACEDIGIDVMRCSLPRGETLRSFVRVLDEQLTSLEKRAVLDCASSDDGTEHLFRLWTLKEAYTKTLGLGMGFDFARIEYDVTSTRVRVDGAATAAADGWEFTETTFDVVGEHYTCVVASRGVPGTAGDERGTIVHRKEPSEGWVTRLDAVEFISSYLALVVESS